MPRGKSLLLGDISKPEHRVLRLANFHHDAEEGDIVSFFNGFDIIDWKRDYDVKPGKPTVAYVIMPSMQELLRAERELDNMELMGRSIRLSRAKSGFTLTQAGLLNERNNGNGENISADLGEHLEREEVTETTAESKPARADASTSGRVLEPLTMHIDELHNTDIKTFDYPSPFTKAARLPSPPLPKEADQVKDCERKTPLTEASSSTSPISNSNSTAFENITTTPMAHLSTPRRRTTKRVRPSRDVAPQNAQLARILLISNLHPDANLVSVRLFFHAYNVVDFLPRRNIRTGKHLAFGFVMLGSPEERSRALREMQGRSLMGKCVGLEAVVKPVPLKEDGSGFAEGTAGEGISTPTNQSKKLRARAASIKAVEISPFYGTPAKLASIVKVAEARASRAASSASAVVPQDVEAEDAAVEVASNGFVRSDDTSKHQASKARDWHGPIFAKDTVLSTWDVNVAHTVLRPWNLTGNDSTDKKFNMVTEEDWYFFQPRVAAKYL